jgi:beta-glucosidase
VRELKGFQRVAVPAGEERRVEFAVGPDERRYWNAAVRDHVLDASVFDVWVGGDSTAALGTTFTVTA